MPSVITMTSGIRASTASITASFVPAGGTNTTEASAPVAAIASATVPNTGSSRPESSMVCPALRGFVPPTTFVPAASILAPCLRPSDPVMPCTMTRLCPVRKIAISCSRRGRCGQLGGTPRRVVHGRYLLDDADARLVQDAPALGGVVAVRPDPAERLARVCHHVQGGHDQARAVADDANLAVELHVVQVLGLSPGL